MSVPEQVRDILLEILDVKEEEVVPQATLLRDLRASSVDLVEIVAALENEFDVSISDDEATELRSVQAICDFVSAKSAQA